MPKNVEMLIMCIPPKKTSNVLKKKTAQTTLVVSGTFPEKKPQLISLPFPIRTRHLYVCGNLSMWNALVFVKLTRFLQ